MILPDDTPMNQDPSLPHPPSAWTRSDWILCLVLGVLAMSLYCLGRNQEFQGDDEYLYADTFSTITEAMVDFDFGGIKESSSSLATLAKQILCAPRHAPLPAVIHGVFYAFCHKLRLPFSTDLLHLPTGVAGGLAVSVLYMLLRRFTTAGRLACCGGTLLLLLSPVFTMVTRGLSAYHLTFMLASTLVALWGLLTLHRESEPRVWIGLALAQVVVSDVLWFVTLPTLLAATMWSSQKRVQTIRTLFSRKVLGPVAVTVVLLLAATFVAYQKGFDTPLSTLLTAHGTRINQGSPIIHSPMYLVECLFVLMGIAFPFFLLPGIVLWWLTGRPTTPGLMTSFGLVGILIFGTLFYGLSPERTFIKLCYQTYLLLPFLFIVLALLNRLGSAFPRGTTFSAAILAILLFFEALACVNFIWKIPISPASEVFSEWLHGAVSPNLGTKAAGYLARRWIEDTWRRNPRQPITLYAAKYNMSFAIFSGLNAAERGWVFMPEFGFHRPIAVVSGATLPTPDQHTASSMPAMVYMFDFTPESFPPAPGSMAPIQDATRLLKYTIRSSSPMNGMAVVYVRPPPGFAAPPIAPGDVNMEALESLFDLTYNRYSDFFPRRRTP